MAGGDGGKEGDWECGSCRNRNYAFRSFCNRCKQPRLLVDVRTPANSKWLPRIGDWICTGCTNNNYASREKCKKCGQPKEVAAMPAITIGGGMQQMLNVGSHQAPLSFNASWPLVGAGHYGNQSTDPFGLHHSASSLALGLGMNNLPGFPYPNKTNQIPPVPNGDASWRAGDWICNCGFHNYSSRAQCKKCNLPASSSINTPSSLISNAVTALGTKRLASEEFVHNFDNKRQNAGQAYNSQPPYQGTDTFQNRDGSQSNNMYNLIPGGDPLANSSLQVNFQLPRIPPTAAILGKGATHWRDGDWMCSNCNNHNYASRSQCNRCKSEREDPTQSVSVS